MKRSVLTVILATVAAAALSLPAAAVAPTVSPSAILSHVAGRPVTARCVSTARGMNFADLDRRGTGPGDGARISRRYCAAVARMIRERLDWQADYGQQLALVSIIHEGEHLRGGPRWRDESYVQCRALHALPEVAAWLGVQLDDPAGSVRWIWRYSPPEYRAEPCPGISG